VPGRDRVLTWAGVVLLAAALTVVGMVTGWRLAGETEEDTRLGRVSFELSPSRGGEIEAFVPVANWGLRADAWDVPVRLGAELRSIDRDALLEAAEGDRRVLEGAAADLRQGARSALVKSMAWGFAVSLLLIALATLLLRGVRPRWLLPATGVAVLLLLTAAGALRAQTTFDESGFETPTFFADGAEIGRILELADDPRVASGYGSEFASIVRSISTVLSLDDGRPRPGVDLYLGSDLHANPLVVGPLAELVGDRPLLLVGDFGQRGNEAEAGLLVPRIAALGSRVIATSGNHDSASLMERLSGAGVTVLTRRGRLEPDGGFRPPPVIDVDGVRVAGSEDPLEYRGDDPDSADRPVTAEAYDDPAAEVTEWRRQLLAWYRDLRIKPDVLMIHQSGLALWLAERLARDGLRGPLTIVTGHNHRQQVDRVGPVFVVNAGTLGAGGVFGAGTEAIGLAQLHFTEAGALRSVDLISAEPFSGAAQATRVVASTMCPGEENCAVEPPPLRLPSD
jgi:hypothetical protein